MPKPPPPPKKGVAGGNRYRNRENRRKNRDKNKFYGKIHYYLFGNFPGGSVVKSLPAKQEKLVRSLGWKYPCRRKQQPTPIFLPRKSHGQRSLSMGSHKVSGTI